MIINVKVIANASQDWIVGFEGDLLKIKCTAQPEKGKANQVVIALIAEYYRVPKQAVNILKGKTQTRKVVEIDDGALR